MESPKYTVTQLGTECRKCGAEMPPLAKSAMGSTSVMDKVPFVITGYLCSECKTWNNFKTRKWFKEMNKKGCKK